MPYLALVGTCVGAGILACVVAAATGSVVAQHVHEAFLFLLVVALPILTAQRARGERSTAWWAVTVYATLLAVSQIGWVATLGIDGPDAYTTSTPFDRFYLVGAAFGIVGLVVIAFRGLRRQQVARVVSDCVVLTLAAVLLWWNFSFRLLDITPPSGSDLLFPLSDVVMLAIVATSTIYQPRRRGLLWLFAATACATVTDTAIATGVPSRVSIAVVGCGWLLSMGCFATFIILVSNPRSGYPVTLKRRAATYFIASSATLMVIVVAVLHGTVDRLTAVIGVLMVVAIIANQFLVFAELKQLADDNRDAMEALTASEARFRVAFEGAPVGMLVIEDRRIVEVNPAITELLGVSPGDLLGNRSDQLVSESIVPHIGAGEWRMVTPSIESARREFPWRTPEGEDRWMNLAVARLPGTAATRVIAIIEDITEQRAATRRLADLAVRDTLTGLANRAAFTEHLERALARDDSRGVSVAFLDLDRFKVINDSLGHGVGDRVLAILAERIAEAVGDEGLVARFAGDEFTIVIDDADPDGVAAIMEGVLQAMQQPIDLDHGVLAYPTCSIGVATARPNDPTSAVLARADAAMYRAKERGRNRVEFYQEVAPSKATAQLRLMGELHRAADNDEFMLLYQPIVDLDHGDVLGLEALIRWRHPERGLVLPGDFIEAAEESGMIVTIGSWVIEEALRELVALDGVVPGTGITMSVNVAARQVNEDLVGVIEGAVSSTGADPSRLWLEITESTLMTDTRLATSVLSSIRDMGVRITVDDFGTGYSSLTYLQRFPVSGLKVDRSFVAGLGRHAHAQAICQAVVSLGHALDLHVVAEGVETRVQREELGRLGCRLAQGYLFGRPEPVATIAELLRSTEASATEAQ
jgi:diguanylate cyclase (GGDEF)-like protein/PAS domain S-box-containing protein